MGAIAIDFGSSNTAIARWNVVSDRPETLRIPDLSRTYPHNFLIPSLVYLQDAAQGHAEIGQIVINRGKDIENPRFFDQLKRRLSNATGYIPELDGVKVTPEFVGQLFLDRVFSCLRSQQIPLTEVIFTVPVQSYERYLRWLENCVDEFFTAQPSSGNSRVRLLDEPTAAALGYAIAQPNSLVLVIDFGGGTLDLALARTPRTENLSEWGEYVGEVNSESSQAGDRDLPSDRKVEVIAKTGQVVGGEDVNRWLLEDYLSNHEIEGVSGNSHLLLSLMERVKIALSTEDSASEVFFDIEKQEIHDILYTRSQLEEILKKRGFYQVLQVAIDELVKRAFSKGILKGEIKNILLVGGSTLIPSVRAVIARNFPLATLHTDKPFEAVAHGALMLNHGTKVQDHLFHSYAIRYWDRQLEQWQYQPLFLRGQTYPTRYPYEIFLRASQPDQESIELVIGEIEKRVSGSAEIIFDGDRLVTKIESAASEVFLALGENNAPQAIARLDPLGQPGSDRLQVLFEISEQRELLITAIDLATQKKLIANQSVAKLR
ncbi:Hsp70 family protein [Tumidithrix helvetica PCC 7403]|uniref:Hsp70 family protein n=1 Tax=Tumidithrix helvetica TaxID=3457545 RepID=UPI003CC429E1